MNTNDPRYIRLAQTAVMTKKQQETMMRELDKMDDEQLNALLSEDEGLREMLSIDADSDNSNITINYANQPNNNGNISFQPPWENNIPQQQTGGGYYYDANMQQQQCLGVINQPMTHAEFLNGFVNTFYSGCPEKDTRLIEYNKHPGMRLYNINPYNFFDGSDLLDYYDMLESERKKADDFNFVFARLGGDLEFAEQFKFKSADDIVKEQIEEQKRMEEEWRKEMEELKEESKSSIVYDQYDQNGYRFERSISFYVTDPETGEEKYYGCHKDEDGQSYTIHTMQEDRERQMELMEIQNAIIQDRKFKETFARLFNEDYFGNIERWENWKRAGLTYNQACAMYEDQRVDWKRHENLLNRILQTASYSKKSFHEILQQCCSCDLDYASRGGFFSLCYDFDRDLHYKKLISTPEEMQNDPQVHEKLRQEYEIKREQFMNKVKSGNLGCEMTQDAHYRPTFSKPNIDELTLEDFDKPENQIMYSKIATPHLATPNMFIPENKSKDTPEDLSKYGIKFDANGNVIPLERTFGTMSVNENGEIISQTETKISNEFFDEVVGNSGAQCDDSMSDEQLGEYF